MGQQDVADLVELSAGEPAGHHAELIWQLRGQLPGYRIDVGGGDDEDFLACGGTEDHPGDHRPGRFQVAVIQVKDQRVMPPAAGWRRARWVRPIRTRLPSRESGDYSSTSMLSSRHVPTTEM